MRKVTVAATQMACTGNRGRNVENASRLVREAAARGAQIILLQELFETPYFCKDLDPGHFDHALPAEDHPMIAAMSALAKEFGVVLPVSFFERAGNAFFNSVAVLDADGRALGIYRKSHIPDGPGYQEKYYFSPGDTGFKVFATSHGMIGVGICWDQWFPECARAMALKGAEMLLYPTAIGSEPHDPGWDSSGHWRRVMQGHAAANMMPVVASNRVGTEAGASCSITFYGSSFIAGPLGELRQSAGREGEEIVVETFDFDEIGRMRRSWGLFRDRRPELYEALKSLDASTGGGAAS